MDNLCPSALKLEEVQNIIREPCEDVAHHEHNDAKNHE